MKITQRDMKTLRKIKKICETGTCTNCIFNDRKNKQCVIQDIPTEWNTLEIEKKSLEWSHIKD